MAEKKIPIKTMSGKVEVTSIRTCEYQFLYVFEVELIGIVSPPGGVRPLRRQQLGADARRAQAPGAVVARGVQCTTNLEAKTQAVIIVTLFVVP